MYRSSFTHKKRCFKSKVPVYETVNCILHKLKAGNKSVNSLFSEEKLSYKSFEYQRNWCKKELGKIVG